MPPGLGQCFKKLYEGDGGPEFFDQLKAAGIECYQQPAGFEDTIITGWKLELQGRKYVCSIGLRDLFGGALSADSREHMSLIGQVPAWVMGKMTAAVQVTDTDVAMRLKARSREAHDKMRLELLKLAEAEGTRAVFKMTVYEVLRVLLESIESLRVTFFEENTLLAAARRNGWLAYRPNLALGKLVRCDEQEWCKDLKQGSSRIKHSWLQDRFDWLDPETGRPQMPDFDTMGAGVQCVEDMEEQSFHGPQGCETRLESWKDLDEKVVNEKFFQFEVSELDLEDLAEAKELMSAQQLRRSIGVDEK